MKKQKKKMEMMSNKNGGGYIQLIQTKSFNAKIINLDIYRHYTQDV